MPNRVFVDANVLSSRTLRDWLFMTRNAVPGMFELYSSLIPTSSVAQFVVSALAVIGGIAIVFGTGVAILVALLSSLGDSEPHEAMGRFEDAARRLPG